MSRNGFSLVEVMVAAAVAAVGLTAAAMLVGTLITQEELNAASLRASNLQEQAVKLYRMDLAPAEIVALLPENCVAAGAPPAGGYRLTFSRAVSTTLTVDGAAVALDRTGCSMVYPSPSDPGSLGTNNVTILRPATRVRYAQ